MHFLILGAVGLLHLQTSLARVAHGSRRLNDYDTERGLRPGYIGNLKFLLYDADRPVALAISSTATASATTQEPGTASETESSSVLTSLTKALNPPQLPTDYGGYYSAIPQYPTTSLKSTTTETPSRTVSTSTAFSLSRGNRQLPSTLPTSQGYYGPASPTPSSTTFSFTQAPRVTGSLPSSSSSLPPGSSIPPDFPTGYYGYYTTSSKSSLTSPVSTQSGARFPGPSRTTPRPSEESSVLTAQSNTSKSSKASPAGTVDTSLRPVSSGFRKIGSTDSVSTSSHLTSVLSTSITDTNSALSSVISSFSSGMSGSAPSAPRSIGSSITTPLSPDISSTQIPTVTSLESNSSPKSNSISPLSNSAPSTPVSTRSAPQSSGFSSSTDSKTVSTPSVSTTVPMSVSFTSAPMTKLSDSYSASLLTDSMTQSPVTTPSAPRYAGTSSTTESYTIISSPSSGTTSPASVSTSSESLLSQSSLTSDFSSAIVSPLTASLISTLASTPSALRYPGSFTTSSMSSPITAGVSSPFNQSTTSGLASPINTSSRGLLASPSIPSISLSGASGTAMVSSSSTISLDISTTSKTAPQSSTATFLPSTGLRTAPSSAALTSGSSALSSSQSSPTTRSLWSTVNAITPSQNSQTTTSTSPLSTTSAQGVGLPTSVTSNGSQTSGTLQNTLISLPYSGIFTESTGLRTVQPQLSSISSDSTQLLTTSNATLHMPSSIVAPVSANSDTPSSVVAPVSATLSIPFVESTGLRTGLPISSSVTRTPRPPLTKGRHHYSSNGTAVGPMTAGGSSRTLSYSLPSPLMSLPLRSHSRNGSYSYSGAARVSGSPLHRCTRTQTTTVWTTTTVAGDDRHLNCRSVFLGVVQTASM